MTSRTYWIVEHEHYGTIADWDWRFKNGREIPYPVFQWKGSRSEGMTFRSLKEARDALKKCIDSGRSGMYNCYILEMHYSGEGYVSPKKVS